jgi:hypothetical protein
MFLSMTSVVGKNRDEVVKSLASYAESAGGGLEKQDLPINNENCCVIADENGHTTIFNPYAFLEWDKSSEFISKDLATAVFSFHIHDGDLWMYNLYASGNLVDQFNPIPDYWDENVTEDEMKSWKGDVAVIVKYLPSVKPADIERYLVKWDLEAEEPPKAYPDDESGQEDWQLLDFMKKAGLPYPLDNDAKPKGDTYKLWTRELPVKQPRPTPTKTPVIAEEKKPQKPWWKFW